MSAAVPGGVSAHDDAPDHSGPPGRSRPLELAREAVALLATAAIIAVVVKAFVAQAFYIPSASMLPQLQIDDRVVVSKLSYRLHEPRRGDIVVFDAPGGSGPDRTGLPARVLLGVGRSLGLVPPSTDEYIKRVVALPGERVEGLGGKVLVDGRELREPYLARNDPTPDFAAVVVPPGTVWVLGDNRSNSADSRVFGPVPQSTVVGRAFVRVWPATSASFL